MADEVTTTGPVGSPVEVPVRPVLSQELLDLIGWYGSSHANGESETLRLWRWQALLTGIKAYAAQEVAAENDALNVEVQALREFRDFFIDRCEGLFHQWGMRPVDLFNATKRKA